VWQDEIENRIPHFQAVPLVGSVMQKAKQLAEGVKGQRRPTAYLCNYEASWREPLSKLLFAIKPHEIIMDEIHKLKSPGGVASRFFARLCQQVRWQQGLTGTLLAHSPLDVYASFRALDPSIFGWSFVRFRAKYAILGGYEGRQVVSYQNLDDLHQRIYRIGYRVRMEDIWPDLPPVTEQTITFDLPDKLMKQYKELEKDFITFIHDQEYTVGNSLTKLLRLAQMTGGHVSLEDRPPMQIDDTKEKILSELLDSIGTEQVVVFARFHADLDAIHRACKKLSLKCCELSGRKDEKETFRKGDAQIIAVQIEAGGMAVDFSMATISVMYSVGYSLGSFTQARARLLGSKQTKPVTFYHLAARRTVDEAIIKAIRKNANITKFIVDEMRSLT
jgi:SNF2 family DNA or RNA helicase